MTTEYGAHTPGYYDRPSKPQPPHIDDIIAARSRSNKHVKSLSTSDTDAEYYKPPYPELSGNKLTVPDDGMSDKIRDAWWNGADIKINGARYSVSEFWRKGEFLVSEINDNIPATEWHPTIGQPEAANSNGQWASGGIVADKDYSAGTLSAISLDVGTRVDPFGYRTLRTILDAAFSHAATGKGKERHARDLPFDDQPIMQTTRLVGPGFPLGQAIKKAGEAAGMIERGQYDAAEAECLGAINYLAGAVAWMREQSKVREAA